MFLKTIIAVSVACIAYFIYIILNQTKETLKSADTFTDIGDSSHQTADLERLSSSVWCHYDKRLTKICTFKNICYLPDKKSFMFVLRNESIISGLTSKDDFKMISLSSVEKHNSLYMKLEVVLGHLVHFNVNDTKNTVFINDPIYLVSRFKSDNIMHVIHDDLLPIFTTYNSLCSGNILECVKRNRLMFADEVDYLIHMEWYRIFSNKTPYNLKNLKMPTCFDNFLVGLSRETLWFQYGFGVPQGPLSSSSLNSLIIEQFKSFILDQFVIDRSKSKSLDFFNVVFLSRKLNRKVLNEYFVTKKILEMTKMVYPEYKHKIKVHVLDPSQNKSTDILSLVITSQVLVGMHGSAMIFSLFLPHNAAIVELFPFGIQPQHVSSTRALSQLSGTYYNYLSWRNFKEMNSVGHLGRPPLLGGIQHLPLEEQTKIKNLKEVPAVECCHNPAYLYRMFQDTVVDETFPIILKQALTNQKEMIFNNKETLVNDYLKNTWFFAGPVSSISCVVDTVNSVVSIRWDKPYNVQILSLEPSMFYHVTVKIFSKTVTLETFSYKVSVKLSTEEKKAAEVHFNSIQVWVKAVSDDVEGLEGHSYCKPI